MKRILVLVPVCVVLCGFLTSWTDEAYTQDPAICGSSHPDACDPDIADALESFSYWNYRAGDGAGTHLLLGSEAGYVWGVTCNHCAVFAPWQIVSGPFAGQQLDTVDYYGVVGNGGAYRQLGLGDRPPLYNSAPGDLLYKLVARPGEALPQIPFMRLLTGTDKLRDGTLILTIGNGLTGPSPTLGWFSECATTAAGGMPAGGRPACCTPERVSGYYGPRLASQSSPGLCRSPYFLPSSVPGTSVCWGGEGDFAACSAAGLTYLGPVMEQSAAARWHWGTWRHVKRGLMTLPHPYGSTLRDFWRVIPANPARGDSAVELGECVTSNAGGCTGSGCFLPRVPPAKRVKTQMMCENGGITTNIVGDSGAAHFAYVDGVWFYIGSGAGPGETILHVVPEAERHEWAAWIYGATADQDGDQVHDASDNCVAIPNGTVPANQCDTDRDGYGNQCDADFDQSDATSPNDYRTHFVPDFGTGADSGVGTDMDCNGKVNGIDLIRYFMPEYRVGKPGPSGLD